LVVALAGQSILPSQVVKLAHDFRSWCLWEGSYLAVVSSERDKAQVERTCLFGNAEGGAPFGRTDGHRVIARPVLVPEILRALLSAPSMGASDWDKLASSLDLAAEMRAFLAVVEDLLNPATLTESVGCCRKVLGMMETMNWDYLLGSHAAGNSVRRRIGEYQSVKELQVADCSGVAALVKESLKRLEGREEYE